MKRYFSILIVVFGVIACNKVEPTEDGGNQKPGRDDKTPAGVEAVDLGLSVKWASCNLGASYPWEYGDYFAWGETSSKSEYPWSTYKWCNGTSEQLTKYCYDPYYGYNHFMDGKTILDPEDDAATVNWGGRWRMPTAGEVQELIDNCTWEWTTLYLAQRGVKVTSTKIGYTDKWIFLPAAGYLSYHQCYEENYRVCYWLSSLRDTDDPRKARFLSIDYYWGIDRLYSSEARSCGLSVRPVYSEFIHVDGVSVSPENATVDIGKNIHLTFTITPANASERGVTWSSSDSSVAKVNTDGLVTGIAAGTAVITATTVDGEFTAECAVTVKTMPELTELGKTFVPIDLGLSVKWASFNLGATQPEEYGSYYAWGETSTKSDYSWSTYKWCMGSENTMTKYCTNSSYGYNGFADDRTVLEFEDDVASVLLGGGWRMPTLTECQELRDNCTKTWTTLNGVYGRKFTSNKSGYTDKWIFLPAAGYREWTSLNNAGASGYYWSLSLDLGYLDSALYVYFDSDVVWSFYEARYIGRSVRPVSE